jgi:DNA-binding transcriptional MerR regulator/quercetin dioxygenase-like cupin family protein
MDEEKLARYRVTEAARLTGVSASTLRLWERHGLVVPDRSNKGQRRYSAGDIARLKRISWYRLERGLNPAAIREALTRDEANGDASASLPALGRKLRSLRHAAGKTLDQVAGDVGLALSALSTLERTSQGVSFKALHDLAAYFGTTVSRLSGVDDNSARATLVRAGDWRRWPETTPGVNVQLLAEGRTMMDCHRFVLAPGAASEGAYRHAGEEFIHVLSGRFEMVLDGDHFFELSPGDSLYFESQREHSWCNGHDGETVLLWINTPPTF